MKNSTVWDQQQQQQFHRKVLLLKIKNAEKGGEIEEEEKGREPR